MNKSNSLLSGAAPVHRVGRLRRSLRIRRAQSKIPIRNGLA